MKRNIHSGFTLIELMIVIAIIGLLAAIALPAYQDYTVRAKATELIIAASSAKQNVAEFVNVNSRLPAAGEVTVETQKSKFVASVVWDGSAIVATATPADPKLDGKTITLTAVLNENSNQVNWNCAGTVDVKYRPASCKAAPPAAP